MQYIDERVVFDFVNFTTTYDNTVYRYDVLIDSEIVFVGNIFVESNTKPVIDVTDILRNFYNGKYDFTWYVEDAKIIREVAVRLYNKEQTDKETLTDKVCFIYRQPNYNSEVTTPILDIDAENAKTMLMIQGWDYFSNEGLFLPTYPKKETENFTADITWAHQPNINYRCDIVYSGGIIYRDVLGGDFIESGVDKFACPLDVILKDYNYTSLGSNASGFISSTDLDWRVGYVTEMGSSVLKATNTIGAAPNAATSIILIRFEGETSDYRLTGILNSENSITITVDADSIHKNATYLTLSPRYGGGIMAGKSLTIRINNKMRQDILSSGGSYALTISASSDASTYGVEIKVSVATRQIHFLTVCDIERLEVVATSLDEENPETYTLIPFKYNSESRYFLKWLDRYGMAQCQPFKGTHTYSEDIEKSTITNYQNIKKITDVSVNGKWKLNTDWISERLYPFYESIFVSPWLQLYDAKEDKVYSVILTNTDYTEKTFKNQNRSLFNLQLEVELDSKQTIIY